MGSRQMAIPILNLVQVLDQEVAPTRLVAEQGSYFLTRCGVDRASFGLSADAGPLTSGRGLND
jgi:hypothetical protein